MGILEWQIVTLTLGLFRPVSGQYITWKSPYIESELHKELISCQFYHIETMLSDMREQMSFTTAAELPINPECNRLAPDLIHTGGK